MFLSANVRLVVQSSAKQKSTVWANYQYNTWLWVGSKRGSGRGITPGSLVVSTLYAVTCDVRGKKRERERITPKQLVA